MQYSYKDLKNGAKSYDKYYSSFCIVETTAIC